MAGADGGTFPRSQKFLPGDRLQSIALDVLQSLYRLLSESKWEYAARAGTTPFHFGATISTDQANYNGDSASDSPPGFCRQRTVAEGSFPKNGLGRHDRHGNVQEWVADCWLDGYALAPPDGGALTITAGRARVIRGGWSNHPGARAPRPAPGIPPVLKITGSVFESPGHSLPELLPRIAES